MLHLVHPFRNFRGLSHQFQILHVLSDCRPKLVAKQLSGERPPIPLPVLGQRLEANVLSEYNTRQLPRTLQ